MDHSISHWERNGLITIHVAVSQSSLLQTAFIGEQPSVVTIGDFSTYTVPVMLYVSFNFTCVLIFST